MSRLEILKQQRLQPVKRERTPPDELEIYRKKYIKPWRHKKYLWLACRAAEMDYHKYPRAKFPNGPCVTHNEYDRWEDLCQKETLVRKQWKRQFAKGTHNKCFNLNAARPPFERTKESCFAASQMPMAGCATPLEGGLISAGTTQALRQIPHLDLPHPSRGSMHLGTRGSDANGFTPTEELLSEVQHLMHQK